MVVSFLPYRGHWGATPKRNSGGSSIDAWPLPADMALLRFAAKQPRASRLSASESYFACALEVMEAITLVAILNCSSRLSMPWRRAIQPKSV